MSRSEKGPAVIAMAMLNARRQERGILPILLTWKRNGKALLKRARSNHGGRERAYYLKALFDAGGHLKARLAASVTGGRKKIYIDTSKTNLLYTF